MREQGLARVRRGWQGLAGVLLPLLTLAYPCLPLLAPVSAAEEPQVRVAILQEVPSARITVLAPCRLTDLTTGALIEERDKVLWQKVEPSNPGLKIGHTELDSSAVVLEPIEEEILRVNARPYRGSLILHRTEKGNVTVVNRLGLEEYLVGALASEADADWPIEALKAHAVVSRTMAAHRIWIQKGKLFDLTADTATHLYHGVASEREGTRAAVEATRGEVLAYQKELLSATFHANCGGHTEDAAELWTVKGDPAPLKGHPDPYCKDLRHFRWKANLSRNALLEALGKEADPVGELQGIEILERSPSGRARTIRLTGRKGQAVLTGRRFRELLGANHLRSLKFTVQVSRKGVSFDGFGWGHGVGFCQWGAYGMAKQGKRMDEILRFYFPGAQRRKLQGLPGFSS